MNLKKSLLYNSKFYYGAKTIYIDVTDIMKINILSTNIVVINNKLFKCDPYPNVIKYLKIKNYNNIGKHILIKENDSIKLEYDKIKPTYNINTISQDLNNYNAVNIFGKGPTFTNMKKEHNYVLHIGINQAVNLLDEVDMLVINDIHNIFKITVNTFKKLKYILTPEYMNVDLHYNINGYWENAYIFAINNGFTGVYIIYNLKNRKINNNIITLESYVTSSNTAIEFICRYTNIIDIQTYGVANGLNYGKEFDGNGIYDEERIKFIHDNIIFLKKKYKKNIIIN